MNMTFLEFELRHAQINIMYVLICLSKTQFTIFLLYKASLSEHNSASKKVFFLFIPFYPFSEVCGTICIEKSLWLYNLYTSEAYRDTKQHFICFFVFVFAQLKASRLEIKHVTYRHC